MPSLSTPTQAPSYNTLRAFFQKALNHNAMSIRSPQTELGHLSFVISEEKYLKASNKIKFVAPTDPENSTTITSGVTTPSMFALSSSDPTSDTLATIRAFEYSKQTYLKYIAKSALRNLILNSVDDKYINKLENDDTGYALVSPLDLMTHLWSS